MNPLLRKHGPSLGVIVVVAWLAWDHLMVSPPLEKQAEPTVKFDRKAFSLEVPPPTSRNPFAPVVAKKVAAEQVDDPDDVPPDESRKPGPPPPPKPDPKELAKSFQLQGTFVGTERRSAMLNERLYFEGDAAPMPKPKDNTPPSTACVTRIDTDRVVLKLDDVEFEVRYETQPPSETAEESRHADVEAG